MPNQSRKEPLIEPKRTFTIEFKRQVVEELLSSIISPAQPTCKHNLLAV